MNSINKVSQFIISCWRISGDDTRIPTSHHLLDRALKKIHDLNILPDWVKKSLHFTDSRIGLQCVELPSILEWAQRSQLTTAPNPSNESTEVQISKVLATHFLNNLDISCDTAKKCGEQLRNAIDEAEIEMKDFEYSFIEDY